MEKLSKDHKKLLKQISEAAEACGQPAYVIGGFVRDYYLDRLQGGRGEDIDVVTVGSGIKLAETVAEQAGEGVLSVFKRFGTAQLKLARFTLEFVGARKESYRADSRKPAVENGSLEDDQLRRDFTINALSWSLNRPDYGALQDPFDGWTDLQEKRIRTPREPASTFSDDPLRMMRAVRFAAELEFEIEQNTYEGICQAAERLQIVSSERILDELNKIIATRKPSRGFGLLFYTGLLKQFFPEMHDLHGVEEKKGLRHKDNLWHTLQVLDNVAEKSGNLWLRWAAILHDIAKPATKQFHPRQGWTFHGHDAVGARMAKSIFRRLGLPMDERMRYVQKLVRLHLRPIALAEEEVTDSAIRRLIVEAGDYLDDLLLLCRADITSKNHRKVRQYLKNFDYVEQRIHEVAEKDRMRNWRPPLDGNDIMQHLNLKPGPQVGRFKKAVEEAILDGVIPNDRRAAFEYMERIKDQVIEQRETR